MYNETIQNTKTANPLFIVHRSALLLLFIGGAILLAGCPAKEEEAKPLYPVWILYVNVFEQTGNPGARVPVRGCPRVHYVELGSGRDSTVNCREGNLVKCWNHIAESFTISYTVSCDGYESSFERTVYFDINRAVKLPGREGEEVEVSADIRLVKLP
jgi:hypothetical protein